MFSVSFCVELFYSVELSLMLSVELFGSVELDESNAQAIICAVDNVGLAVVHMLWVVVAPVRQHPHDYPNIGMLHSSTTPEVLPIAPHEDPRQEVY